MYIYINNFFVMPLFFVFLYNLKKIIVIRAFFKIHHNLHIFQSLFLTYTGVHTGILDWRQYLSRQREETCLNRPHPPLVSLTSVYYFLSKRDESFVIICIITHCNWNDCWTVNLKWRINSVVLKDRRKNQWKFRT